MNEGWLGDVHFVLFDEREIRDATEQYGIQSVAPGSRVLGLRSWDDFIVSDPHGRTFSIPTVPFDVRYAQPIALPDARRLRLDESFVGKVKWYVMPLVFGGDPRSKENLAWVSHTDHRQLVVWWNAKYRELKPSGAGA